MFLFLDQKKWAEDESLIFGACKASSHSCMFVHIGYFRFLLPDQLLGLMVLLFTRFLSFSGQPYEYPAVDLEKCLVKLANCDGRHTGNRWGAGGCCGKRAREREQKRAGFL